MKLYSVIIVIFLFNCSSVQKNFVKDRGNDLGDIVSISYGVGFGLQISISSISAGIGVSATSFGFKYSDFLGTLTQDNCVSDSTGTFLFGYENRKGFHSEEFGFCKEYLDYYLLRNKAYKATDPFKKNLYGRIKINAALIVGGTVEFNFYELFDFWGGFFGYDLLDDDWNQYYEKIIQAEKAKLNVKVNPN